jgi:hypothetical protein
MEVYVIEWNGIYSVDHCYDAFTQYGLLFIASFYSDIAY